MKIKWLTDNKKRAGLYIALLLLAFLTEVGLFNLSSIRTLRGGAGIELTDRFSVSEEAAYNAADGSYTAGAEEFTMYMGEVNADIKNLYIDMDFEDTAVANSIYLTDEGNVLAYKLPEHYLLKGRGREDSQYVTLHPYGKVRTIKMVFQVTPGESFRINQISMNVSKPFQIEPLRVAVIYGVFVFAAIFRRKSKLHQIAFRPESKKQWAAGVFIMGIFLALATGAFRSNLEYWTGMGGNQYHALTRALSEGHFSLDYSVPDELLQLENPYDMNTWDGIDVYWDNAFYNGKYYCYFGITPVLLLYLPCYLLTGTLLQNYTVSLIFLISMITGSFYLVRQILKKWGDGKVPFFAWPLLSVMLCFSENYFFLYMRPYFYNIPIIGANALTVWGLGLWLKGMQTEKGKGFCYFLGSLCMALVAGCRPQMVLISFLAIPLFWDIVIRKRELFSKDSIKETLAICIPYIAVAGFLMYYNYARFGSIFDFGANYNMTTNDMTRRGFNLDRLGTGLFTFLFQPPNIVSTFPYVREALISSRYMGRVVVEFVLGGIFMTNIITLLNGLTFSVRDVLKRKGAWALSAACLCLTIILGCIDATIAGILQRYTADIVFAALFPACIICCILLGELREKAGNGYYILCNFMAAAFLMTLAFDFFMMFANTGAITMEGTNPELFFYMQTIFGNI